MIKPLSRPVYWLVVCCLVVLSFALAACGDTTATSPASNATNQKTSAMTVTIKEKKGADGKDTYSFDPTSITVKKGDTITIQNLSDEIQDIDMGDAQKAGVDVVIPVGGSGTATFKNSGTFMLQSEKGATITAIVN